MNWWDCINDPTEIIKAGVGFALSEEWDVVDEVIVPAYRRLLEGLLESKDYFATIAREHIAYQKRACDNLIDTLYDVARVTDVYAKFRAALALKEATKYCKRLKNSEWREWIERKLKEAINEDLELAKILAKMLE